MTLLISILAPLASGAQFYSTTIQTNERTYRVKKTTCEFVPGAGIKWTEAAGESTVTVETEPFAHGQTKNAYKVIKFI